MSVPGSPAQARPVLFLFTGLIILTASVWVFLLILRSVYGRYDLADLLPSRENVAAAFAQDRAAILESGYSDHLMPEGSTWLHDNVSTWKRFLQSSGTAFDVVDDRTVETAQLRNYALLILPGSRSLSQSEIQAIKQYIDGGGRVIATGGTATFTETGAWRGWDFLSQVFGLQFTREITPDQTTKAHTLRGGLPITAGIPTGYALRIATWDHPIACRVVEPRTTQASTWYNFKSDSGLTRESIASTAGIAYGTYGRGRFVWMGFELNSVLGSQDDYVYFDILCHRCVDWLMGTPTAQVRDWPAGYSAAAMISLPLSGGIMAADTLLSAFHQAAVPVSLFHDSRLQDAALPGYVKDFADELGVFAGSEGSSVALNPGSGRDAYPREGVLLMPGHPLAISLPRLLSSGYLYVADDSSSDRAVPTTFEEGKHALVVFTKTARGDDEVIRQFGLTDTSLQLYTYREDVDRVLFQGGLYMLEVHPELQGRGEYSPVMRRLGAYLKERNFWTASGSTIARWWLARSGLEVNVHRMSKRRIALVVSNASSATVRGAVIQLNINEPASDIDITSDILGTVIPPYRYNPKTQVVEITIPSLGGKSSLSLYVDFDNPTV